MFPSNDGIDSPLWKLNSGNFLSYKHTIYLLSFFAFLKAKGHTPSYFFNIETYPQATKVRLPSMKENSIKSTWAPPTFKGQCYYKMHSLYDLEQS